jgi:hypothetical protein
MLEVTSAENARTEIESVLRSALFVRSPSLSRLLQYLGAKYLEGTSEEIKEYHIGVEAMGRSATFDPTQDAAARVEAHRLRKRLREFYQGEGLSHPFRIEMPLGHYAIVFRPMTEKVAPEDKEDEVQPEPEPLMVQDPVAISTPAMADTPQHLPVDHGLAEEVSLGRRAGTYREWFQGFIRRVNYRLATVVILAIALCVAAIVALRWRRETIVPGVAVIASKEAIAPNAPKTPAAGMASQSAIRIACGRTRTHTDRWGEVWEPDRDYEGGSPFEIPRQFIARAHDPRLFQAGRTGNFTYKIPLTPGVYELRLYFMEGIYGPAMPAGGGEISRLFEVQANGKRLLSRFDIYSDAGGSNIADVRVFKDMSPGPDHMLTLTFQSLTGSALVNAIELTPATPHHLNPVRIVTQDGFYTDSGGVVWKPDRYFSGGQTATHAVELHGTRDPDLFARERYGHFDYAIPVDKGTYRLTLYFAEKYFGPDNGAQAGTRVFDVSCNGVALLREFDLLKEAGLGQAVVKTFHGLTPNGQGTLLVSFSPVHDYASLYALEVIDESN